MKLVINKNIGRWIIGLAFAAVCAFAVAPSVYRMRAEPEDAETQPVYASAEESMSELEKFILEHEQLRSMQLSELDEIVNSEDTPEEIAESALRQKLELIKLLETESTIAGILQARGYRDAAVTADAERVNILIDSLQAGEKDIARITELVISHTDVDAGNIKIIPIN